MKNFMITYQYSYQLRQILGRRMSLLFTPSGMIYLTSNLFKFLCLYFVDYSIHSPIIRNFIAESGLYKVAIYTRFKLCAFIILIICLVGRMQNWFCSACVLFKPDYNSLYLRFIYNVQDSHPLCLFLSTYLCLESSSVVFKIMWV